MSMRPAVGYACGHGQAWAWRSLVMGHGHAWHGWLAMGAGVRGAWGVRGGGRSPMAMAGGGGEWGPHTKESIKCIPQSGTLKNQKKFLPQPRISP
jgi:hypothetical protein